MKDVAKVIIDPLRPYAYGVGPVSDGYLPMGGSWDSYPELKWILSKRDDGHTVGESSPHEQAIKQAQVIQEGVIRRQASG